MSTDYDKLTDDIISSLNNLNLNENNSPPISYSNINDLTFYYLHKIIENENNIIKISLLLKFSNPIINNKLLLLLYMAIYQILNGPVNLSKLFNYGPFFSSVENHFNGNTQNWLNILNYLKIQIMLIDSNYQNSKMFKLYGSLFPSDYIFL